MITFCFFNNPRFWNFIHSIYHQITWDKGPYSHYEISLISLPTLRDRWTEKNNWLKYMNKRDDFWFLIVFSSVATSLWIRSFHITSHMLWQWLPKLRELFVLCSSILIGQLSTTMKQYSKTFLSHKSYTKLQEQVFFAIDSFVLIRPKTTHMTDMRASFQIKNIFHSRSSFFVWS